MVDYLSLKDQIPNLGKQFAEKVSDLESQKTATLDSFTSFNKDNIWVEERLLKVREAIGNLRCASPSIEKINASYARPSISETPIAISADGSQIYPDITYPAPFYLLNAGCISMDISSNQSPIITHKTSLKYGDDMYDGGHIISKEIVNIERDLFERELLCEQALAVRHETNREVVALVDGLLELWSPRGKEGQTNNRVKAVMQQYQKSLSQMMEGNIIVAGYVEAPRAYPVVTLLEFVDLREEDLHTIEKNRTVTGITDKDIFSQILVAGERSAVFKLISDSQTDYPGMLSIHFFYINIGRDNSPVIARVEIPQWVANDKQMVNLLHHTILTQAEILGTARYPYILHRAHEEAVVTFEDREEVLMLIRQELISLGHSKQSPVYKHLLKLAQGRRRFSL